VQVWRRFQRHGVDGLVGDEKLQHPSQAVWHVVVIVLASIIIGKGIRGTGQFHIAVVVDVKGAYLAANRTVGTGFTSDPPHVFIFEPHVAVKLVVGGVARQDLMGCSGAIALFYLETVAVSVHRRHFRGSHGHGRDA
jgi:hypothetical protein